ncbi:12517_t:CDS:2 [Rhizophagus irregularis]|nr:12517_t:CDS:2 [Rhizophagus irregularis]
MVYFFALRAYEPRFLEPPLEHITSPCNGPSKGSDFSRNEENNGGLIMQYRTVTHATTNTLLLKSRTSWVSHRRHKENDIVVEFVSFLNDVTFPPAFNLYVSIQVLQEKRTPPGGGAQRSLPLNILRLCSEDTLLLCEANIDESDNDSMCTWPLPL